MGPYYFHYYSFHTKSMRIVETRNRCVHWRHKRRGHRKCDQIHQRPHANTVHRDSLEDVPSACRFVRRQFISWPVTLVGGKYRIHTLRIHFKGWPDVPDSTDMINFQLNVPVVRAWGYHIMVKYFKFWLLKCRCLTQWNHYCHKSLR